MKFQVVTRVPDGAQMGNLAVAPSLMFELEQPGPANDYRGVYKPAHEVIGTAWLATRMPVFTLGEVVVADFDGREMVGLRRKADKWDVDVEEFDTIEAAVERAQVVLGEI